MGFVHIEYRVLALKERNTRTKNKNGVLKVDKEEIYFDERSFLAHVNIDKVIRSETVRHLLYT